MLQAAQSQRKERKGSEGKMGMRISQTEKSNLIQRAAIHERDKGSPEIQISLLTKRIDLLSGHFKDHVKDHSSRRGLLKLVAQRRKLLEYLKKHHTDRYQKVAQELGIRK